MAGNTDDYRVALIQIAREIALAGTGGTGIGHTQRLPFLRKFRAAYLHLAATVEAGGSVLEVKPTSVTLAETDALLSEFDKQE